MDILVSVCSKVSLAMRVKMHLHYLYVIVAIFLTGCTQELHALTWFTIYIIWYTDNNLLYVHRAVWYYTCIISFPVCHSKLYFISIYNTIDIKMYSKLVQIRWQAGVSFRYVPRALKYTTAFHCTNLLKLYPHLLYISICSLYAPV